jgi:small subunit ribosomal protein S20
LPARKSHRQSETRAVRNRRVKSITRTVMNKAFLELRSGDSESAETAVRDASAVLDRGVQKGILHKNNASRRKSRIAARLNQVRKAAAA